MSYCSRMVRPASGEGDRVGHLSRGELSTKMFELVHPARPKILSDLLERRTQELKTVFECEVLAEGEGQVLLHSLTDDADRVVVDVFEVCGDDVGVVSVEVV